MNPTDMRIMPFASESEWEAWLSINHLDPDGVWIRIFKKASGMPTVTYAEALDVALCYGWIDAQKKSYDEVSFLQRFVQRRSRSIWSDVNRGHIARLTSLGRIKEPGILQVEAAKADGRWDAAYSSPSKAVVPDDFLAELEKHPKAKAFFETLNKQNKYAVTFRLQTAKKPETREKRIQQFVEMFEKQEKFY